MGMGGFGIDWYIIKNSRKMNNSPFESHLFGALDTVISGRTKNVLHDRNRTFSTQLFSCRYFSGKFS